MALRCASVLEEERPSKVGLRSVGLLSHALARPNYTEHPAVRHPNSAISRGPRSIHNDIVHLESLVTLYKEPDGRSFHGMALRRLHSLYEKLRCKPTAVRYSSCYRGLASFWMDLSTRQMQLEVVLRCSKLSAKPCGMIGAKKPGESRIRMTQWGTSYRKP
jgi:hypothetical protein